MKNRIFISLLAIAMFSMRGFSQCNNATPQVVTTFQTSSICLDGNSSYIVRMLDSEVGFEYFLSDTLTGNVISGPFDGTEFALDFSTGNITETTTFEVIAQPKGSAGNAYRLGGAPGDFASNANAWDFDYSQGYTLEFVFNGTTNAPNFYNSLFSLGGNFVNGETTIDDLEVYFQQNNHNFIVLHGRGQSNMQYNQYTSPASSTDVHIAIVFDPSLANDQDKMKVYYDGVPQQQTNTDSQITTMTRTPGSAWYIGDIRHQDFGGLTDVGKGTFDELRVWNYGRTDAEINTNKSNCVSVSETGLAHYYRFDTGSGSTLIDETGNGRNMDLLSTIFNNPGNAFWVTGLVNCASECQTPMANTVTIGDLDAPTLSLASSAVNLDLDATGNATINIADLVISASDNCSTSSALVFTANITSFTCDDLGVNPVFVTVTDESGNETTAGTAVNVRDVMAPTITLSNTTPLEFALDANTNDVVINTSDLQSAILDNCDGNPSVALSKTTFGCADLGLQTVTITATDAAGNVSTGTETIEITDKTAPVVVAQDITVELDATGNASIVSADINNTSSDNCTPAADLVLNISKATFSCEDLGTNTVTLTVADASGNESTATVTVTVEDNIDPVAVAQDITVELGQNGSVTVDPSEVDNGSSDNCSVTLALNQSTFTTVGSNNITLTATDPAGNTATATAIITVEQTKDPQTITFSAQSTATYGDAPIALSATASSGLPVTYVVSGAGELINGNEVQIIGAGSVTVTASQAGDDTFAPAEDVVATVSVAKANLTATAEDLTITFGSNQLLSFSITYTGFVGDDDALVIDQVPTASSVATVTSDVGVYDLVVSGGSDDNYDFIPVDGSFTIEKADQILTFPALPDVDIASVTSVFLSAVSDAGLPITYTLIEGSTVASISGTEVVLSATGVVTVEASQAGTNNYNAAIAEQQSFTVTDSRKQNQTISISSVTDIKYGAAPITLSSTASSGLDVSYTYLNGPATLSGNELTITGAGTVNIELSQAGNDSFNAAESVTQTITVGKASLTITPDDKDVIIGEAIPALTFTLNGFVNGDDQTVIDQLPVVTSPTADLNVAGSYPIIVSGSATDDNYSFIEQQGVLTVTEPLNVNQVSLRVFPNPATDIITIEGMPCDKIELVDLTGKIVKSSFGEQSLEVFGLEGGVYYLRMFSEESTQAVIRKIIIK